MTLTRGAFLAAALAFTLSSFAALSPKYQEWGDGPVQWIMTDDEHRQWKQIKSDDEAEQFIELFWARRDPTPGTPANEFKADFEARVAAADKQFPVLDAAKRVIGRGAMSDRGQTLIVLGKPDNIRFGYLHNFGTRLSSQAQGRVEIWVWGKDAANTRSPQPHQPAASHRENVGIVEFIEDERGICCVRRDPRDMLSAAGPLFIKKAIVNPSLTTVPDWAKPQAAESK